VSVEGGATEPVRKHAPSDRRIRLLPSPGLEDGALSRDPGGDEVDATTPQEELSGSAGTMAAK
jgi:hypothetical protein